MEGRACDQCAGSFSGLHEDSAWTGMGNSYQRGSRAGTCLESPAFVPGARSGAQLLSQFSHLSYCGSVHMLISRIAMILSASSFLVLSADWVCAQTFPTRPVRILTGETGGTTD